MRKFCVVVCVVCIGLWGAVTAYSEPRPFANSVSTPNQFGVTGLYTLHSPDVAGTNGFSIGIFTELSKTSLPEDVRTSRLLQSGMFAGYSLANRLDLGVMIPYRGLKIAENDKDPDREESGIGDILATFKFQLVREQEPLPALGVFGSVSFPTGDNEVGLGSGTYDFTVGAVLAKQIVPLRLYANLAFLYSGWEEGEPNPLFDNYQHSLLYGAGVELPTTNDTFRVFSEVTFVHEFGDDDAAILTFQGRELGMDLDSSLLPPFAVAEDPVDDAGQVTIGVRLKFVDQLVLTGGASVQILGAVAVPDAPKWRSFVNMSYRFGGVSVPDSSTSADVELLTMSEGTTMNRCPEIMGISLSDEMIRGGEQVRVAVNANDPDADELFYFWVTYFGSLMGQADQVVWTAPECGVQENSTRNYEITIEVNDGVCTSDQVVQISVLCDSGKSGIQSKKTPETTITFSSGSTQVDNIGKAKLDAIATLLKQFPDHTIVLEGHTDATGNATVNQKIGLQRAKSVKRYFAQRHGIDPNRITTISYGSEQPVTSNDTEAGRAQNRRVEVYRKF